MAIVKPSFVTITNLKNVLIDASIYGVSALAMTIAIINPSPSLPARLIFPWLQTLPGRRSSSATCSTFGAARGSAFSPLSWSWCFPAHSSAASTAWWWCLAKFRLYRHPGHDDHHQGRLPALYQRQYDFHFQRIHCHEGKGHLPGLFLPYVYIHRHDRSGLVCDEIHALRSRAVRHGRQLRSRQAFGHQCALLPVLHFRHSGVGRGAFPAPCSSA